MINVNQITAQLARMPDQALQRYAQMHKADPYILSLALAESNRRKQMRQGAQMNAPEQPKVADQAIAGMGSGVAALPAPNLQGMEQTMAAGGIVAFDEGGEVERYQSQGLVQPPAGSMFPPGSIMGMFQRGDMDLPEGALLGTTDEARRMLRRQIEEEKRRREQEAAASIESRRIANRAASMREQAATPGSAAPSPDTGGPRRNTGTPSAPAASARDDLIERLLKPVEPVKVDFTPSTARPLDAEGILALQRQFEVNPETVTDPFLDRRQAVAAAQRAAAEDALAKRKKQIEEMGVLGADREARLKAREEKLGKQEKDLGPLALLQAGFAMMSGASPFALQNMGVGAQSGLKTYSEGLDKLAAAKDRLDDAFGQLETARRSERMLTDRELSGLEAGIKQAVLDGEKMFLQGAQDAYGIRKQDARTAFSAVVQGKQREAEQAAEDRRRLAEMQQNAAKSAQEQTGAGLRSAAQLTTQRDIARMEAAAKSADAAVRKEELRALAADKSIDAMRKVWAESKVLQSQYPNINDWLTITGKGTAGGGTGTDYSKWGTPTKVGP
jgi:hypothetical protein